MVHVQNLEPKRSRNLLSIHERKKQNNLQTHIHPKTSMSTYNFDIFLVPQCASAYHIFHYNLIIIFIGCISGASGKRADMTSTLYQNLGIGEQWNFSNLQ
jgi:hypothetical protein